METKEYPHNKTYEKKNENEEDLEKMRIYIYICVGGWKKRYRFECECVRESVVVGQNVVGFAYCVHKDLFCSINLRREPKA